MVAMREFKNELLKEADGLRVQLASLRPAQHLPPLQQQQQQQQQPPAVSLPGVDPTVWLSPGNLGQELYEAAGFRELQQMLGGGGGGQGGDGVASRVVALEQQVQSVLVHLVQRNQQLEARLAAAR